MKIASLTLQNVLGAPDGTYSFRGADGSPAPVVLIRGDEATGKTSLLRAIAALKEQGGAYGAPPRPSTLLRRGQKAGRLSATWVLTDEEQQLGELDRAEHETEILLDDEAVQPLVEPGLRKVLENAKPLPRVGRLELIPASRQLRSLIDHAAGPVDLARRARDDADKYAGLAGWIVERAANDGRNALRTVHERGIVSAWDRPDSLAPLRAAIMTLLPGLRLRGVGSDADGQGVFFDRETRGDIDLFDLSASEMDAILLAIVVHKFRLDHSVVLIDEPVPAVSSAQKPIRFRAFTELAAEMQVVAASSATELSKATPKQKEIVLARSGHLEAVR